MAVRKYRLSSDFQKLKYNALTYKIDRLIQQNHELRLDHAKIKKLMNTLTELRACYPTNRRTKVYVRKLMYFILERMFWSQFNNSQYVAVLLNFVFEIEGHLYCFIIQNTERCPSLDLVDSLEFREYFIRHAYREKVLFGGCRLLNSDIYDSQRWLSPVEMAASLPDPALLVQMLRYGALLSCDNKTSSDVKVRRYRHGGSSLMAVLTTLTSIVRLNPNLLSMEDLELSPVDRYMYRNFTACCGLLLKDCPYWPVNSIYAGGELRRLAGLRRAKESFLGFIEVFSTNVVRNFKMHFIIPMELKQLCRLCVRRVLNDAWLLPHGINNLEIPESLKAYLHT